MLVGPGAEGSLQLVLHPVDHCFLQGALLLVLLAGVLQPSEEASTELHLTHADHIVGHDLFGQVFALGHNSNSSSFHSFDLSSFVVDLQVLPLNYVRDVSTLLHKSHLHLG